MLGPLAHIARVSPLDDTRLDAHHRVATGGINHTQRKQALIKDVDGPGQAQGRRSNPLLGGSPQQQGSKQGMRQQQGVEFLDHPCGVNERKVRADKRSTVLVSPITSSACQRS